MNLVVDIGNSRMKAAVFSGGELIDRWVFGGDERGEFDGIFRKFPEIDKSVLSSTRDDSPELMNFLRAHCEFALLFDNSVPVPLVNRYATPQTLGRDRLAAAVGAKAGFPDKPVFIVDFGSAITEDIVTTDGCYLGGAISPGLSMRFRALHEFTGKLPLISPEDCTHCRGGVVPASTEDAIIAGVMGGIYLEIEGLMAHYGAEYPQLVTIFTGGDAPLFEKRFKNTIFANQDLVLTGLNTILDYNANRKDSF